MKSIKLKFSVPACLVTAMVITFAGCTDVSEGKKEISTGKTTIKEVELETKELLNALGNYTVDQRDEAVERTETALDKMDERIDALKTRIDDNRDQMNEDAREKARATLKAMGKQRTEVASWYGRLKTSSADAWDTTVKGLSNAYSNLSDAWGSFEKELAGK